MSVWIVMRSRNDIAYVGDTLRMLGRQTVPWRLAVFDNASTDGTRGLMARHADLLVDVPEGHYMPGRVLNQAMSLTDGDVVVFLNADCTPDTDDWLETLLTAIAPGDAAVFGRQRPRPDCDPLLARDTEDTFGDGRAQAAWRHCFSMASSAIRRSAWLDQPFNETLRYSEDIDWTWRARLSGRSIRYVAAASVRHSHNYTLRQSWRRHFGEGFAEAHIFEWSRWQRGWLRYVLLPFGRRVIADWRACVLQGRWQLLPYAPLLRGAQALGRRQGFRAGLASAARMTTR